MGTGVTLAFPDLEDAYMPEGIDPTGMLDVVGPRSGAGMLGARDPETGVCKLEVIEAEALGCSTNLEGMFIPLTGCVALALVVLAV
mmetsp:Transcript_36239/g.70422  ORF Transcript_36239/g.70422 Transcript_36239/m.70422 type:complete len:86 (-) Transcript_36239:1046-1303(-)